MILDTATELFAELGYDATSTNAIAARAGMSPGSLYQFFSNKEDIAEGLAARFVPQLAAAHAAATAPDLADVSMDELIDRIVDPIVAVNVENPGMKEVFGRADMPASVTAPARRVQGAVLERIASVIQQRLPDLDGTSLRYATTVLRLFATFVPLVVSAEPADREMLVAEFKTVLRGYLEQIQA